jgi:hypothetical protein
MKTIRTVHDLEVLLHCHVSPTVHPRYHVQAVKDAISSLVAHDMIEQSDRHYSTTEKGKFYLEHLLSQPFPVVIYAIPKD